MRDVAASAGVSIKTVSRVVNGEDGVSVELTDRVRSAAEALDFRPNAGASSLRRAGGKTATVGLLLEDVSNPFSAAVARAVEDVAVPRGVMVFCASLDEDPCRERELVRALVTRRVDGLIIAPSGADQAYLGPDVRAGTPVVCVDREPVHLAVDAVVSTNAAGAIAAVQHLFDGGHRRVALLGDRGDVPTARQRHQGYLDALTALGLPVDPALIVRDVAEPGRAEAATIALLTSARPPTALFTAQNLVTLGAIRALRRLGLQRTVAVVGFDDFPLADLLAPGVTVVAQDPTLIGRTAATLLFARLTGEDGPPRTHFVPTTLIRRGSGEIRPS